MNGRGGVTVPSVLDVFIWDTLADVFTLSDEANMFAMLSTAQSGYKLGMKKICDEGTADG